TLSYDAMGNIASLSRFDGTTTKTGTYSYAGNQLTGITGGALAAGAYTYDGNGNATTDGRNGVTLAYNYLNLPVSATKSGLSLSYVYDATGAKLKKVNGATGTATDYVDGIQYVNGTIDFIQTEEGIARRGGGSYSYEYNLTDHLGNVRYTFNRHPVTGQLQPLQADDYYAFGMRKVASPGNNKYLYNGKELQEELEQYDYGARFYDPVIGRWNVVDPLAEDYDDVSPYNYVLSNPINFTDPDGMWVNDEPTGLRSTIVDGTGRIIDHKNDGDNSIYQLVNDKKVKIGTERDGIDYGKLIGQQINQLNFDPNPIPLNAVSVTAKKPGSAWAAIGISLSLRTGTLWGAEGANPEPVTKTIGGIVLTAFSAYVIGDAVTTYYYDKKKAEEWNQRILEASEHTKGARPSTKGKHQKGQARKAADRGGEKGEKMAPRKRPGGWKGPWPPKS
ncbi:RHS repeat domain-containing protein, partial [Pedobacter sp. ASV12]|uniref:RHS repeat domain-containing protein n=1 Tax=Pedobacter sp. ASV12 TaxID=2795120 RepID=UPI0018ED4DB6